MTSFPKDMAPGLGWPGEPPQDGASADWTPGLGWPVNGSTDDSDGQETETAVTAEIQSPETPPSGHASWGSTTSGTAETGYVPTGAKTPAPRQRSAQGESQLVREALKDVDVPRETSAVGKMKVQPGKGEWPKPPACRVMVVANQKGGVGKTTSSVNLAASLAMHGQQVLVVDLDPQGNASTALGVEHHTDVPSIYDVLIEDLPLADIVVPAPEIPNLYCAPATLHLAGAEIELVSKVARESRLKRALDAYDKSKFDYVLIDCPPSLGLLTVNALVGGQELLIPIQCEYYALEGLGQLIRTVDLVKAHLNPELNVSTILLTMYDARTRLAAQVADDVRSHFGDVVLSTLIPRSVRVSEAPSYGQSVMTYDPGSTGALAYAEAASEMAQRGAAAGDA
ncbi:MAG: Cobyrinic acid ac-diamide synthase [Actinomycetia bacterium]|nr:Cobyrinic acid ac-diamide synthase [Actinomycetes bacterium]